MPHIAIQDHLVVLSNSAYLIISPQHSELQEDIATIKFVQPPMLTHTISI